MSTTPLWPILLACLSAAIALISLLWNIMTKTGDQSRANLAELRSLEERCSLLEMKMGMFWRLVEEHLSGMLKKPIHLEMDMLLDKLKDHTLTFPEARILHAQLQKTYLDAEAVHAHEKLVAILVISAVEALIRELERKPCEP